MYQHIENAIDILLHGLQDLGHMMGVIVQDKTKSLDDLDSIGFFISAVSNLTEALNILRADAGYELAQREQSNLNIDTDGNLTF